ncbi:MKRN2 opposite strand protein [Drosophila grimshawi]|uniref:GH13786 n=1 Tax=Drosophila grimshawi TaxID=7222 RepID=B4JQZ2_DROGR|nr:MKRN2 opposite strand protein [Drosophila grimshawi]XP_032595506.1 MKRN2 opposite strand protein [Drosophila grimshawi]EDV99322.1 GH13786 [Drosophila grimshawi]
MLATTTATQRTSTTTITSDPGILCFHHCNVKVFCFALPHTCPHCNAQLDADANVDPNAAPDTLGNASSSSSSTITTTTITISRLLPFRLPYPFVRATQHPCAIVLRPSTGDFLNDYSNATDLHIAVTTSAGDIVEFDRDGLQRHRRDDNPRDWWQSLLVGDVPEPWHDYWDEVLQQICAQSTRWSIACYEETSHNCYTFVLAFLQALGYAQLSEAARTKTSFCEKYIVPRTTTAGKYISLYRRLRLAGIHVHRQQSKQRPLKVDACDGPDARLTNTKAHTNGIGSGGLGARLHARQTLCTIEE